MALTERDLEELDPLRLDREIASAARAVRGWRRRLRDGDGLDEDPFWAARTIAGRSAFLAIRGMPESDPLRSRLLRWVYRLAEQRIDRAALVQIASERHRARVVSEPEHARLSTSSMLGLAFAEPGRRAEWLRSFVRMSGDTGRAVALLWERRQEVALRMALPGPDAIESPGLDVAPAASRWLDRTQDMLDGSAERTLAELIGLALAETAKEGSPSRLLPRTLLDLFRDSALFSGVDLDPGKLPAMRGPTSLSRALARVGAAWVDATAPHDQPFVVAHDPYGLRRRLFGALLGRLPAESSFARRALAVDTAKLRDHVRVFATALLIESRAAALRVLLRKAALEGRRSFAESFEDGVVRAFGVRLPPNVAGAVFRLHSDDPQRFAGLLLSSSFGRRLRDTHDEDFYRNPRAVEQLRDEAHLPPESQTSDAALIEAGDALYADLAHALG